MNEVLEDQDDEIRVLLRRYVDEEKMRYRDEQRTKQGLTQDLHTTQKLNGPSFAAAVEQLPLLLP